MSSPFAFFLRYQKLPLVVLISLLLSGVLAGLRQLGLFERVELGIYDQLVQFRAQSQGDPRLLIVAIDDETLQKLNTDKVSDQALHQVLKNLKQYQPRVIGVDILRDVPIGEGREELINYLNSVYDPFPGQPKPIILTCQLPSVNQPRGIDPLPVLDLDSAVGYANVEADVDQVVRRIMISNVAVANVPVRVQSSQLIDSSQSNCLGPMSLGFLMSLTYLQAEDISLELTRNDLFKLENTVFRPLSATAGAYHNLDPSIYQLLIDYQIKNPVETIEQISFFEVLDGRIQARQVRDRIVLIGYTTKDGDIHLTPYGTMPGVFIHAQIINQILANVLDQRPTTWYLSDSSEWLWIIVWGLVGGLIVWKSGSSSLVYVLGGTAILILSGITIITFTKQGWLPLFVPGLALITSGVGTQILKEKTPPSAISTVNATGKPSLRPENAGNVIPPTVISLAGQQAQSLGSQPEIGETKLMSGTPVDSQPTVIEPKSSLKSDPGATFVEASGSLTPSSPDSATDSSPQTKPVTPDSSSSSQRPEFVRIKPQDPFLGEILANRYRIDQHIGGGGMGQVYLASDTRLRDRRVAVKVMTAYSGADKDNLIRRFDREVGFMAAFSSINIVKINDFGLTEPDSAFKGAPFYVMEYLEGVPLSQRLREVGRLSIEQAVPIIRQICDGLREAHNLGIVHRDLKPDNIYLIPNVALGEIVKILDFGIAKIVSSDSSQQTTQTLTAMGAFIGTYRYASPEQCLGDSRIDHRTDIYSLGVLIYEMLSGTNPYNIQAEQNTQGYWISSHIGRKAQPLKSQLGCENISEELNAVIMKCLEKSPDKRYANIDDLETALRAAIPNNFRNYG